MDKPDDLLPVGLQDALPARAAAITRTMRDVLDAMDRHGYDRVRPPLIEFEQSLAGRMDGVATRRMVRFTDPDSLRTLALRSDITVQIGRIAATSLAAAARPLRLCYAGEVAMIVADQLDPARQRLQMGAELIGSDNVSAAIEAVTVALDALEQAGITGVSVDFTLPDLVDTLSQQALPLSDEAREAVRRELDMKDAGGLKAAGGEAYLPLLYATGPFDTAIDTLAAIDAGGVLASRIEGLRKIATALGNRARLTLDPSERHGFEYQSWFGFTLHAEGARASLGRGGTYALMGSGEPATGFSLYMEPVLEALGAVASPAARKTCFLPLGHDRAIADRLRREGWRTLAAVRDTDDAASLGCTHFLQGTKPVAL